MWSSTKKKYYGCQYGKTANPQNILSGKYKTSSRYVKDYWKHHGSPDIIVIHRTFLTAGAVALCRQFEHEYLTRVGVIHKNDWLNRATTKAIITDNYNPLSWQNSHKSRKTHAATDPMFKDYLAQLCVKNMHTASADKKRKETFVRIKHSQGQNNPNFGVIVSDKTKRNISNARKEQHEMNTRNALRLNRLCYTCIHC